MANTKNIYKICSCCVMDTSDKNIVFDERGRCQRCQEYESKIEKWWNHGYGHDAELNKLLNDIKTSGEGKEYDCLLGLSGGLDSSYMLHMAVKEWGLRPFVFHVNAGWNLPIAESNIKKMCDKLGVELHVENVDFEDMRQLQLAFFKTGHASLDAPQDHAFVAMVDKFAEELGVKYILNGFNLCTEAFANPQSWYEGAGPTSDGIYLKDVLRKHGGYKTKHYTYTSGFKRKFWLPYVKGVKTVSPLDLVPLTRQLMIDTLANEYGYQPYKQKHFEDQLTKFLEGWWLPTRFDYDIRKAWLSSLVLTGQLTREDALKELENPPLTEDEAIELFTQVAQKLKITEEELMSYHELPKTYIKYRSNEWSYKLGIKIYALLGLRNKRIRK